MFRRDPHAGHVPAGEDFRFTDPAVPTHACCCTARPAVQVIMPPAAGRDHPVDLWLCRHHYRVSLAALLAAGADVRDLTATADPFQASPAIAAA